VCPIIQLVGAAAIFAICCLMLRTLKANGAEEEEEADEQEADEQEETAANEDKAEEQQSDAENAVDEAYEKYDLSEFEEK
jgi:flagellar biosynthesis/type III secretory pathway M-ring protein FliF/YscJ